MSWDPGSEDGFRLSSLTGQAQFRQLRDRLLADQAVLHQVMDKLELDSRVTNSPLYLQRHLARSAGVAIGNWRLRWRLRVAGTSRHVVWSNVSDVLAELPVAVVRHYDFLNRRVIEVNLTDVLLQSQISPIERFLGLRSLKLAGEVVDSGFDSQGS